MKKIFVTIAVLIYTHWGAFSQGQEKPASTPASSEKGTDKSRHQRELKESEEARTREFEHHRKEEANSPAPVMTPQNGPVPKTDAEKIRAKQKASMSKHMAPKIKPAKHNSI